MQVMVSNTSAKGDESRLRRDDDDDGEHRERDHRWRERDDH